MRHRRGRLATLLAATVLGCALSAQSQPVFYGTAARVNGAEISNETLERSFEEYLRERGENIGAIRYPERVKEMKRETLDLLIDQELAWQAAQKAGVVASAAEVAEAVDSMRAGFSSREAFVRKLSVEGYTEESYNEHIRHLVSDRKYLDSLSSGVEVSDAEVHSYYTENLEKMRMPELVRARHILLTLAPDADAATRQAVREKLAGILAEARREDADFAALAKQYSEDATAAEGGDLGYFPRGQIFKPLEDAAFALEPGELSDVVETPSGLHIILLEDHRAARQVPEEEVRDRIREHLVTLKRQQAAEATINALRSTADIEILLPL